MCINLVMTRMTLEDCITALNALLGENARYDGGDVTFNLGNHNNAVAIVSEARKALATMIGISK